MTNRRPALIAIALPVIAALIGLGVWQLQRRTWKLALIEQVDHRLAAAPVGVPGPAEWPHIDADAAYTRVVATGHWDRGTDSYVQAVTDIGPGYWVMTPFVSDRGFTLLVNRGFVPTAERGTAPPPPESQNRISGLLRVSEPKGGFLRSNDPGADRWYSRDVPAIAARRGLGKVAPYFVDADRVTWPAFPRGGLTVIRFPNNHLQYALTWFAMAALLAAAIARMALTGDTK